MRKESIFNPDLTGVQKETQRQQEAKREAEEKELKYLQTEIEK